jgi:alkylation response protein AidB-like acyl-CoA dehydrogenase
MILTSDEHDETATALRQVLLSMCDRVSPPGDAVARAEAVVEGRHDLELWARLSGELGGAGLAVPAELGGGGASLAEAALVFEEVAGARLACVPLLGTTLAAELLVRSGDAAAAARWVPGLAAGELRGALAWSAPHVAVRGAGAQVVLDGTLDRVVDAVGADVLVVPAAGGLVVVELAGVRVEQLDSLDLTRAVARVRLRSAPGVRLGGRPGPEVLEELRDVAALLLAAEQLGVAEQALRDAVAHAKVREQFGRVIGSFQALKHLLADMATATDLARSLVEHAVWTSVEEPDRLREAAAMAKLAGDEAACRVSAECVQVLGGLGFSWEHHAHLFFRKARANAALLGGRQGFVDRLLTSVGAV